MTCIVGVTDGTNVYMAGDRGMSDGNTIVRSNEPKIFGTGPFLVGFAGTIGIGQALQHHYEWPLILDHDDIYKILIPDLRGYINNTFDLPPDDHTHILLGYEGRLYEISTESFSCIQYTDMAIGSGKEFALGSLYSTAGDPEDRVTLAVEAAIEYSTGCSGPVDIMVM